MNKSYMMKNANVVLCFLLFAFLGSCTHRQEQEKKFDSQKNVVHVKERMNEIVIDEKEISSFGIPYIVNEYLLITDYKSPDKLIHIFDKNSFDYLKSVGERGNGPGEIANLVGIVSNERERRFYVIDYGRQKILDYSIDSLFIDPFFEPGEKGVISNGEMPANFQYVNDTLAYALFVNRMETGDYKPLASKWNMKSGDVTFMNYAGHPSIKRKRVSFASSVEQGLYVEAYWYNDLMSLCTMDGNLKYNLFGENWSDENTNKNRYFRDVFFCGNKIIGSYLGGERLSKQENDLRVNYPTRLLVFDLEGNYIATLETGCPIITFCYDHEKNRIIFAFDDEMQFGYLDLKEVDL